MADITVVKVGGAILENDSSREEFLERFSSLSGNLILVHGGGRTATTISSALGIETTMVGGRRVTDAETLKVVTMVYAGLVNKSVVASLQKRGVNALGLSGADAKCVVSTRRPPVDGIDYGFVGDVKSVDTGVFLSLIESGVTPVVAPLSYCDGTLLNTNADSMACAIASALASKADVRLVFCFEKEGVLDGNGSIIDKIDRESYSLLKENGTVSGGMLPKLDSSLRAIESGVREVRITSAQNLYGGTVVTR